MRLSQARCQDSLLWSIDPIKAVHLSAPSPSAPTSECARRSNWLFWLRIHHIKAGEELEFSLSSNNKPDANMTSACAKEAMLPRLKPCPLTPRASTCSNWRNSYLPLSKAELNIVIKKQINEGVIVSIINSQAIEFLEQPHNTFYFFFFFLPAALQKCILKCILLYKFNVLLVLLADDSG